MRRVFAVVIAAGLAAASGDGAEVKQSQPAKNVQMWKAPSAALGEERQVAVMLPPGYEASTRRYPVLYLLHGLGDDHTAWSFMTNLSGYAAGHDLIIVMPDAGRSFYMNSAADPKAKFEDFIVQDLIAFTDSRFRTIPVRRARAIAGLSMGGYGAAMIGLKHWRRFSAIGAFSGVVGMARMTAAPSSNPSSESARRMQDWQTMLGPPGSTERADRDPFALLERVPMAEMPDIYIACGGQDFLVSQNRDFVKLLADKKIAYEYREISPRGHTWDFWDDHIRVFLDRLAAKESWR